MDHFDQVLTTAMLSSKYSIAIRSAVRLGKKTLDKYYSKTDDSHIYRIAMGKCPLYIHTCMLMRV